MIMVIDQEEFDSFSTDVSYAFLFTHIQIINDFTGDNQGNLTKMQFGRLEAEMLVYLDGESSNTVFQG